MDRYAVFAALSDGTSIRLTLPTEDWDAVQREWTRLDDLRREGHVIATKRGRAVAQRVGRVGMGEVIEESTPTTVRHFVVRSMDDPNWNDSAEHMGSLFLLSKHGYKAVEGAGRAHGKANGRFAAVGGWVYDAQRHPLVQGWFQYATTYAGLAKVDGTYRYTVRRFHADWTLGRQGVTV